MRAEDRAKTVAEKLRTVDDEFEEARKRAAKAKEDFATIKKKRFDLFNKAFTHISEQIQPIYKDLTREEKLPMGGQAYVNTRHCKFVRLTWPSFTVILTSKTLTNPTSPASSTTLCPHSNASVTWSTFPVVRRLWPL